MLSVGPFTERCVMLIKLDGEEAIKVKCPRCNTWGLVDADQVHGRVSMECECGFHETHDINPIVEAVRAENKRPTERAIDNWAD